MRSVVAVVPALRVDVLVILIPTITSPAVVGMVVTRRTGVRRTSVALAAGWGRKPVAVPMRIVTLAERPLVRCKILPVLCRKVTSRRRAIAATIRLWHMSTTRTFGLWTLLPQAPNLLGAEDLGRSSSILGRRRGVSIQAWLSNAARRHGPICRVCRPSRRVKTSRYRMRCWRATTWFNRIESASIVIASGSCTKQTEV